MNHIQSKHGVQGSSAARVARTFLRSLGMGVWLLVFLQTGAMGAGPSTVEGAGSTTAAYSLGDWVAMLETHNPEIAAARAAEEAARAAAWVRGSVNPPSAGVEYRQAPLSSFPDPSKDAMEVDYFLQQDIMFPGKLWAMGGAEGHRADTLKWAAALTRRTMTRNLKRMYFELYEVARKREYNQRNRELVAQLQRIVERQYSVGRGSLSDVYRVQTEASTLKSQALILEQAQKTALAEFNAMLNRPWESPVEIVSPGQPIPVPQAGLGRVKVLAEKNHPDLKAAQAEVDMQDAEHAASLWAFFPDLMVKGMYMDMRGGAENAWALMGAVTIPFAPWALPQTIAAVSQTAAQARKSRAEYQMRSNQLQVQLQRSWAEMEVGYHVLALNRDTILRQAEQTWQTALSAYQTNQQDFLMLLEAYRTLWMARENVVMAEKNYWTSLADLEWAVGSSWETMNAELDAKEVKP